MEYPVTVLAGFRPGADLSPCSASRFLFGAGQMFCRSWLLTHPRGACRAWGIASNSAQ